MRLQSCDLEILGIFLFGPRWQCPLARAIHRDDRLVRRWVAEERPVSIAASEMIEKLTRNKHGDQMRRLRANYLNMIGSLTDTQIRARLMTMDLGELRVDNQLRQAAALMETDLALALIARASSFRMGAGAPPLATDSGGFALPDLHRLCSESYCALRDAAWLQPSSHY
jgi:hypothetical protein